MYDTENFEFKFSRLRRHLNFANVMLHMNYNGGPSLSSGSGVPKAGISNERFSAKVKLSCKLDIHTVILSASVYLRWRVGLQFFQGVA